MYANSRVPGSAQTGIHDGLAVLLDRHLESPFRKPYTDYNRAALAASLERRARVAPDAPLILDSCCGVGASSIALARAFPDHYVIGVDQSESRLSRNVGAKAGGAICRAISIWCAPIWSITGVCCAMPAFAWIGTICSTPTHGRKSAT